MPFAWTSPGCEAETVVWGSSELGEALVEHLDVNRKFIVGHGRPERSGAAKSATPYQRLAMAKGSVQEPATRIVTSRESYCEKVHCSRGTFALLLAH